MLKEQLLKWKNQLKTLEPLIKHCKICFKPVNSRSFYEIINEDSCICDLCQNRLVPVFKQVDVSGVNGVAIYEYDENIKALLYQLKGCHDIELAPIFLNRFKKELHLLYKNYIVIPAPSYYLEDENRGFNHVEKIFENVNLNINKLIEKKIRYKQAESSSKNRRNVSQFLSINNGEIVKDKKVLLIDDVMTTGSTLEAMISLIRKYQPKDIKILVMSMTVFHFD